ncbi:hypothetical protein PPYR_10257 [Photinus pyralis]|uniref:Right handed beta helix domain-containing protein n=2 Tax=Photinus pyralis TaxID=7054 RepID=A0A1Y1KHN4_PHOPY|nr:uncharacterized protein LOC116173526 [Photinus pyralis]KAB0796196.1 hypothetical protein PPYR_10257 [Photinus pyralis]
MKVDVLVLLCISYLKSCLSFKVQFRSCEEKGFQCVDSVSHSGRQDVTYECPSDDLKDITLDFWIWDLPPNIDIDKLTIKNCHTLRLRFGCTELYRNITILYVHHVVNLRIFEDDTSCNPTAVIFEHVDFIRSIPKRSFSQARCHEQHCGLKQLVFENVKIGVIETNAIELSDSVQLFRITNTMIDLIEAAGIRISARKFASVYILNSAMDNVEALGVQVDASKFVIADTSIDDLSFAGISASVRTFEFTSNSIGNSSSGALAISAESVDVLRNKFQYLQSGAFNKIGPRQGIFRFNFLGNYVRYVDVGGLHPQDGSRVHTTYANNSFYCTCEGLSWLGCNTSFGVGYEPINDFYKHILEKANNNTCIFDSDCILPLGAVQKIAPNGICQTSTIYDQSRFCDNYDDSSSARLTNSLRLAFSCFAVLIYYNFQYLCIL